MRRLYAIVFLVLGASQSSLAEEAMAIRMEAIPGLKYNYQQFHVRPGALIELHLKNVDEMLHNLVITKPGRREAVVAAALDLGVRGEAMDYVPDSEDVLWSIPVLPQGQEMKIEFRAPDEAGDYPFVCTFPGHGFVMYGTMRVSNEPGADIMNVQVDAPESQEIPPRVLEVPSVHRLGMPDAGPAAIAVALPDDYSYTWDAGSVGLRYVWQGGFVQDFGQMPEGAPKNTYVIEGEVIYTEDLYTVRGDDPREIPEYRFLGYALDSEGYPTFHYMVDSLEVAESIKISNGVIERQFNTFGDSNLSFRFPEEMDEVIKITVGNRSDQIGAFRSTSEGLDQYTVRIQTGDRQ